MFYRNEVQVVSLADFDTIYKGLLNFPEDDNHSDGNPPLVKFSPNLELVLIGNVLLETRAPKAEPLFLPMPKASGNKLKTDFEAHWTCTFSACSRYIALVQNRNLRTQFPAELLLFHIDMQNKTYARCFQDIPVAKYHKLTVDFHPHRPELVLNGWVKGDPEIESLVLYQHQADKIVEVTTLLLDLEKKNSISLGRPKIHGTPYSGKTRPEITPIHC